MCARSLSVLRPHWDFTRKRDEASPSPDPHVARLSKNVVSNLALFPLFGTYFALPFALSHFFIIYSQAEVWGVHERG